MSDVETEFGALQVTKGTDSWLHDITDEILVQICLYCLNARNLKFDQLIVRKIMKVVATSYKILRLRCTKFEEELIALPRPYSWIKRGLLLKEGREGNGRGTVSYTHLTLPTILRV